MNQGQVKFLSFILERVQEDKMSEARELLMNNFKKQQEGTFSKDDIKEFIPKISRLIKADKLQEVEAVMKQFSQNFSK